MATRITDNDMYSLNTFSVDGETSSLAQRWKTWKRAFLLYVVGKGVTQDAQKKALLLHTAGLGVQQIYYTLVDESNDENNFDATVAILDNYFVPKANVHFERHKFHQLTQTREETIDEFVCRLRQGAATCEFGDSVHERIRDQIISKCYSHDVRRKLLEKDTLTLDAVLNTARAHEKVHHQLQAMKSLIPPVELNVLRKGGKVDKTMFRSPRQAVECYACGHKGHVKNSPECPAKDKRCNGCGRKGHFKAKCRSGMQGNNRSAQSSNFRRTPANTNAVAADREKSDDPSKDYVFILGSLSHGNLNDSITLNVGGIELHDFLIDSGAACNVVDKSTWEWLKSKRIDASTRKSAKTLYAYGSTNPLPTLGTFTANVFVGDTDKSCVADFIVIDVKGHNLLGRDTARDLGLLHIGPLVVNSVDSDIYDSYPNLFKGVGTLKGYELKLQVNTSVQPIAQSVRRVPFQLREKVDKKLDELLAADIIEEVPEGPTSWISPLVIIPKPDGDIRVCVDMRRANEAIVRERHPIPSVEELLHRLNGSTMFSKLDLKWGFHQITLDKESRNITTFVTHRGLYRYKRLMFGLSSAPEKYQKVISDVLKSCDGVANIADDIIVFGTNASEHNARLHAVLNKLQESGLTLNRDKCQFRLSKLTFFGHDLSSRGIKANDEKVQAIQNARPPQNEKEARSFMGLVQYSAKFIPNLATIGRPIMDLTRKHVKFVWGKEQQSAFERLKSLISRADTLAYFKNDCKTRIIADASPVGLGAVLTQLQDGLWRVISYASRSLSDVESRYSQTEKEALGLVWACERFSLYVFGKKFELETDHKPLKYIYSKTSKPSARIERWVLRLQSYDFDVVYKPGSMNIADALSRLNRNEHINTAEQEIYDFVREIAVHSTPVALTTREIEKASAIDPEFDELRRCIVTGDWASCKLSSYLHVRNELCCYGQLLLRGTRLIIPKSLREQVLQLAHEGHQGIVKTKNRLRSKVWWPKMDTEAERLCRKCHGCQVTGEPNKPEPMHRVVPPSGPWQDCACDILGPLPSGEYIFVIVDYFSRYYEIAVLKSVTTEKVILALIPIFSRFGLPLTLRTDNGPQFISNEFEQYLKEHGIKHYTSIPLWPQSNGEVERQNRSLMKAIRVAHLEKRDWRREIYKFLTAYRSTPQSTTGASPSFLMFGREMKTKLPELIRDPEFLYEEVRDNDWQKKLRGKVKADTDRNARESSIQIGDTVLLKADKTNKLTPNFDSIPRTVVEKDGRKVTVQDEEGNMTTRDSSFVKEYYGDNETQCESNNNSTSDTINSGEQRPKRNIDPPVRFKDYCMC